MAQGSRINTLRHRAPRGVAAFRVVGCRSTVAASAAPSSPTTAPSPLMQQFLEHASGEFEAVAASFTAAGEPIELPPHCVPDAYKNWDIKLYDWQAQCSATGGSQEAGRSYAYTARLLMPTVGCEADAVAFNEFRTEHWEGWEGEDRPVLEDGSYVTGPLSLEATTTRAAIESCISDAASRTRQRVTHRFERHWSTKAWSLAKIDVHQEVWDAPYKPVRSLAGCGGGQPPFATTARTTAEQLQGSWVVVQSAEYVRSASGQGLTAAQPGSSGGSGAHDTQPLLLPLNLWASAHVEGENIRVQVGKLLVGEAPGKVSATMRVSTAEYGAGQLRRVRMETREREGGAN